MAKEKIHFSLWIYFSCMQIPGWWGCYDFSASIRNRIILSQKTTLSIGSSEKPANLTSTSSEFERINVPTCQIPHDRSTFSCLLCFSPQSMCWNLPKDRGDNKQSEPSPLWHSTQRVTPGLQKHKCKVREHIRCTITLFVQSVAVIG